MLSVKNADRILQVSLQVSGCKTFAYIGVRYVLHWPGIAVFRLKVFVKRSE